MHALQVHLYLQILINVGHQCLEIDTHDLFTYLFQGLPYVDVKIKWPNDLYLNNLKVGGILCTSTYKSKKFNISAGDWTLPLADHVQICLPNLIMLPHT